MNINDFDFHDAEIPEVRKTELQTLDFIIDFYKEAANNVFEKRVLRFEGVINSQVKEIPFGGRPTILEIIDFGHFTTIFGTGSNQFEAVRNKIEMQTTAGN